MTRVSLATMYPNLINGAVAGERRKGLGGRKRIEGSLVESRSSCGQTAGSRRKNKGRGGIGKGQLRGRLNCKLLCGLLLNDQFSMISITIILFITTQTALLITLSSDGVWKTYSNSDPLYYRATIEWLSGQLLKWVMVCESAVSGYFLLQSRVGFSAKQLMTMTKAIGCLYDVIIIQTPADFNCYYERHHNFQIEYNFHTVYIHNIVIQLYPSISCTLFFLRSSENQEETNSSKISLVFEVNLGSTSKTATSSYIMWISEPVESSKITVFISVVLGLSSSPGMVNQAVLGTNPSAWHVPWQVGAAQAVDQSLNSSPNPLHTTKLSSSSFFCFGAGPSQVITFSEDVGLQLCCEGSNTLRLRPIKKRLGHLLRSSRISTKTPMRKKPSRKKSTK
ncbi:hypothetical protein VP01_3411g1 [Puccinia sorghi]|uniref:Uncharacterized protein n=1 Tax=Puccinia sorghi TaxID=27349 RepID=A0A0L6UWI7_9BASI|nr:hypothetical protein VP01_3411g1 [Puccinia sorghi]